MSKNSGTYTGPLSRCCGSGDSAVGFLCFFKMQWKLGPWEKRFPGGLPWRQARLVSWCPDAQGEIFRVRASHAASLITAPSNGRVNESIFCRVWVLKIARFEGVRILGVDHFESHFSNRASNRLEVVRASGNGENMEAWPEVVVETLGRQ